MRKWIILSTLGVFFFMVIVDGSIVNIAIPTIAKNLNIATEIVTRMVLVYLLVITVFLLFWGQISDQKGRVRIFQLGAVIFTFGSFLSGFSINFETILIGRIVQAFGASMTMATSYAIVTDTFKANELGRALSIESLFISLGALAGPGVGGLILRYLPWEYIFWVNIPIGILTVIISLYFFKNDSKDVKIRADFSGLLILIATGISFFTFDISLNENRFVTILAGLVTIFLILSFYFKEKSNIKPLLDFKIFKNRSVGLNLLASLFFYTGSYFYPLLTPIYLQVVLKLPVSFSGIFLMVMPIVTMAVSPYIGVLTDKHDKVRLMKLGMLFMVAGTIGMVLTAGRAIDKETFILWSAIMAIGTPLFTNPNNTLIMTGASQEIRGMVGSANSMVRELGMMIGSFIAPGIFYGVMSFLQKQVTQSVTGVPNNNIITSQNTSYIISIIMFIMTYIFVFNNRVKEKNYELR